MVIRYKINAQKIRLADTPLFLVVKPMEEAMKNVLLLCLSPVNKFAHMNKYSFDMGNNEWSYVDGVMTNEAPTKALIKILSIKDRKERLDRIVLICSDTVHKAIETDENNRILAEYDAFSNPLQPISHVDFYKNVINDFAKTISSDYKDKPIEYREILIPDFTDDRQVSASVIEAAEKVIEFNDIIHLHIDFNGGQRYIAFMLLAVANLMKIRDIDIQHVMTMNFDNKVISVLDGHRTELVPIQNMSPLFNSFDLISGINEYVKYGRINGLKKYFEPAGNQEIHKLLQSMEKFSHHLQLCRTGYIMKNKDELLQELNTFIEKEGQQKDTYSILFRHVSEDIRLGYHGLLDGELPEIINWCVERDMIQQALTFTSEELPGYFWTHDVFKATKKEKSEYDVFLSGVNNYAGSEQEVIRLKRDFRNLSLSEKPSKYAYNWMIKYLPFSTERGMPRREYRIVFENTNEEPELVFKIPTRGELKRYEKCVQKLSDFEVVRSKITDEQMKKASNSAQKLLCLFLNQSGRVASKGIKKDLLGEILMMYFLLKDQRNATNHADGGGEDDREWTYEMLREGLTGLAKLLSSLR